MHILITGGTGFIGSRLALACLGRGDNVTVLGQTNTPAETENAKEIKAAGGTIRLCSVLDRTEIESAMQSVDIVYHLAACQHEANVPDQRFWDVNVTGTRNMLDAAVKAGAKRFIHGSTIGVYRADKNEITRDDSPLEPGNIYGRTKLEGEKVVRECRDKIPAVIIRIPETYGPGDRRLVKLFKTIHKDRSFLVGGGRNLHHLIYIDDLIDVFFESTTSDEAVGETFVVAGEKALTTREMMTTIGHELGRKGWRVTIPFAPLYLLATVMELVMKPLRIQPPLHRRRMNFFILNFSFACNDAWRVLRFRPGIDFAEGVKRTAEWYREKGLIPSDGPQTHAFVAAPEQAGGNVPEHPLSAWTEPFDSFWEAPDDIDKGYASFGQFYRCNYLEKVPHDKGSKILVISCGPGYFVHMLSEQGYTNVLGIDSFPSKVAHAEARGLNCRVAQAVPFLEESLEEYDLIFCEQELNHLTKEEIVDFMRLVVARLTPGGRIIVHGLNAANPLTGQEAGYQNFDHFNMFTEYSLRQVMEYVGLARIRVFPLNLYVFYKNPMNYVAWAVAMLFSVFFRAAFILYGKSNKIWTKKLAAVGTKS